MKILIYSSNSGKQRPEPVEYVPGWQRLQEPASGAPASTVLQHRTEPKISGSGQATLHTGNLIQSSMFPPGTDGMRQMWLRLLKTQLVARIIGRNSLQTGKKATV